jgi:hypothetical protein
MTRPADLTPFPRAPMAVPPLDHHVVLPILGIATRFETNSRAVLDVVTDAFGAWRALDVAAGHGEAPACVRIVVRDGADAAGVDGPRAPVMHIWPDATRFVAHSPSSVGVADPARREAVAFVTAALVADARHFQHAMLEALTLALLSQFDRHPVHAASVRGRARVALLVGPSGSGKSTLAYAAQRAGLTVLSDDRTWIQLRPSLRIWGWPARARLRLEARDFFPELAAATTLTEVDGKHKLDAGRAWDAGDATTDERGGLEPAVCLLAPGAECAALERATREEVLQTLMARPEPGFDRFPERQAAVAESLAAGPAWRLRLSNDPREAIPLIERIVDGEPTTT